MNHIELAITRTAVLSNRGYVGYPDASSTQRAIRRVWDDVSARSLTTIAECVQEHGGADGAIVYLFDGSSYDLIRRSYAHFDKSEEDETDEIFQMFVDTLQEMKDNNKIVQMGRGRGHGIVAILRQGVDTNIEANEPLQWPGDDSQVPVVELSSSDLPDVEEAEVTEDPPQVYIDRRENILTQLSEVQENISLNRIEAPQLEDEKLSTLNAAQEDIESNFEIVKKYVEVSSMIMSDFQGLLEGLRNEYEEKLSNRNSEIDELRAKLDILQKMNWL